MKMKTKIPWQCRWFGHDWTTYVGFPMKRVCDRCERREKGRDKHGMPTRWVIDNE